MNGYDVFCLYLGLKLHFTKDSYDYVKFNGKTKASTKTFLNRNDRHFFDRLAKTKKGDVFGFLVSNFVVRGNFWFGELFDDSAEQIFTDWKRRIQSLSMVFSDDVSVIVNEMNGMPFDDIFKAEGGRHPIILRMVVREDISIETFILLNKMLGFFDQFDRVMPDDYLWAGVRMRSLKYEPFMAITNTNKYREILLDKLQNND